MIIAANTRMRRAARWPAKTAPSVNANHASSGPTANSPQYILATDIMNMITAQASAATSIHRCRIKPRCQHHAASSAAGAATTTTAGAGNRYKVTLGSRRGAMNSPSNSALSDVPS